MEGRFTRFGGANFKSAHTIQNVFLLSRTGQTCSVKTERSSAPSLAREIEHEGVELPALLTSTCYKIVCNCIGGDTRELGAQATLKLYLGLSGTEPPNKNTLNTSKFC